MADSIGAAMPAYGLAPAPSKARTALMGHLQNKDSLQAAILLREVLSPPLAFRKQGLQSIGWSAGT